MNETALGTQIFFQTFKSHDTLQLLFATLFPKLLHINVYFECEISTKYFSRTIYVNIKLLGTTGLHFIWEQSEKKLPRNVKTLTIIF